MKISTVVLLTFIFFVTTNILAQEKKINEQELTTLRSNATEKLIDKSYRVKMKSENYRNVNDSVPYWFSTTTIEITPDAYHSVNETETDKGVSRNEVIKIGERQFIKLNNEDWKELNSTEAGLGGGGGQDTTVNVERKVEYKYLGNEIINNQNAHLYEIKSIAKYKLKDTESVSIHTERFWFNKDGLFLKREYEYQRNKKVISHSVYEYEYDPNIKIEAPLK